jgi:hypothetical protein
MKNQNIIQNSPDAIYTCNQLGFIKSYNKAVVSNIAQSMFKNALVHSNNFKLC